MHLTDDACSGEEDSVKLHMLESASQVDNQKKGKSVDMLN
jgi:hypothetical protein